MLATAGDLPAAAAAYGYEMKWDGMRAIVYWDGVTFRLESRNLIDVTGRFPELAAMTAGMRRHRWIVDGEIVAWEGSRPSFGELQKRMHVSHTSAALAQLVPVSLMVFDLLYLDDEGLLGLPYERRREALSMLRFAEPALVPPMVRGNGEGLLEAARDLGLEGVMAKRLDSVYERGRRSGAWIKVKIVHTTELVIGGWVAEKSGRGAGRVGALLLGYFEGGKLVYVGSVGTGFSAAEQERLTAQLKRWEVGESPFVGELPRAGVRFVVPALVAAIEYRRWPEGGMIQQAAYKGLRTDKSAREIVRETVKA